MALKFVYVIVSSEADWYVEQALVSVHSLKMYNPDAMITLVFDKPTFSGLAQHRKDLLDYADEVVVEELPDSLSLEQRSRYLKTSLRQLVKGDFLYIDNDTVITGPLDALRDFDCEVGAVYNQHGVIWDKDNRHPMLRRYHSDTKIEPEEDDDIEEYFNGGVIFCRDTPKAHKFFQRWHDLWKLSSCERGYHKDQPDMWRANLQCGNLIKPIDGVYNFQAIYPNKSLKYLGDLKIFHYFSSTKHVRHLAMKNEDFLRGIRDNGLGNAVESMIVNIKDEYLGGLYVIMDKERLDYFSPAGFIGRYVSVHFPFLNDMARSAYRFFHPRKK